MATRDLWPGADVRLVGNQRRRSRRLEDGTHAVVVDPRRHHITSFSALYHAAGQRPQRPGRGVRIRLDNGSEVIVPRRAVELVAPDHPLSPAPDGTLAEWWLEQLMPWGVEGVPVGSLVPSGFPAVGQVLHPWLMAPDGQAVSWREVAQTHGYGSVGELDQTRTGFMIPLVNEIGASPAEGELDEATAAALVDVLSEATSTPNDVCVAVWEGWGDVPPQRFPGAARISTPGRGHFLLRGPLRGVLHSVAASRVRSPVAGLWWPVDRAWFVATEIDFEWTFVAGDEDLIDALVADDRLEVAPTRFDAAANKAHEPA